MTDKTASTSAPILNILEERWSPRAFDPSYTLPESALTGPFEAARWSPSSSNTQPWRFIVTRRGTEAFDRVVQHLTGANPDWAQRASALVLNVAETVSADGKKLRWAEYDLGQSAAYFTFQAQSEGLHVHQMGGFDVDGMHEAFDLPESSTVVAVMAVGKIGDPAEVPLNENHLKAELAPRTRKPITEVAGFAD